ncbi:MAG: AsmA family protein [Burkholderiaceae bacterium]
MIRLSRSLSWAAGVAGVLGLGVVAGELAGWPFLRLPVQNVMADAAGVPVALNGRFRTRLLWRPHVEVEHLNIAAGGGVQAPHLLDARDVELAWRWSDVWRWRRGDELRLQRLHAGVVDAHLLRTKDGSASWALGDPNRKPKGENEARAPFPRFGSLQLGQGSVVIDDALLDAKLDIEFSGGEGQALPDGSPAGYQASVTGRHRKLPVKLQIHSSAVLPLLQDAEADAPAPPVAVLVEGEVGAARLRFEGRVGALLSEREFEGSLRLRGPSLAQAGEPLGVTLPHTPPFDLKGELAHSGDVWQMRSVTLSIGRSKLDGDFKFDTANKPPRLTGRLGGSRLALADLGPAVGTSGTPAKERPRAERGRVLPVREFDLPSMRGMDADLQVAIDELDLGSSAVEPLKQLRTHLLLTGGVLRLDDLKATVAGGQFSGATRLDASAEPARWNADMAFSKIDVAGWIKGLRPTPEKAASGGAKSDATLRKERSKARAGGDQPVQSYLTGSLSGNLKFAGRGRSTADILGSTDGNMHLSLSDGTLSHLITEALGLDIAQALGVVISGDRPLPLRCARVDMVAKSGVLHTQHAVLDNADSTVKIEGTINLRDESLALKATSKPKDFSPLALSTPIIVGGTLGSPDVGIEGGKLAGKVLGAAALGAVLAPLAAVLPFIDTGSDDKSDPCAPGASTGKSASANPKGKADATAKAAPPSSPPATGQGPAPGPAPAPTQKLGPPVHPRAP